MDFEYLRLVTFMAHNRYFDDGEGSTFVTEAMAVVTNILKDRSSHIHYREESSPEPLKLYLRNKLED